MVEPGGHTLIIGERINPTGRPALLEQLAAGRFDLALAEAAAQAEAGADAIDVNVGVPGVDEPGLLERLAKRVAEETGLTVSIDSSDPQALARALASLPEGTIVNSVTGEEGSLGVVLPVAAERSSLVIGMAKDGAGIPETVAERMDIAARIAAAAGSHGIPPGRLMIDFLTLPAATGSDGALVTLECIARAGAELGVGTVLGASNVSFGMPSRPVITAAFLAMAIGAGLTAALVNPLEAGIVQTILAADMLAGRDPNGRRFVKDHRSRRRQAPGGVG